MLNLKAIKKAFLTFVLLNAVAAASAQDVNIPDPGLDGAIRQTLSKPTGPLTQEDMLLLINLNAGGKSISSVEGLEFARNLSILDLDNNSITNFPVANALTNLSILDLFNNHLTSFSVSNTLANLTILDIGFNSLNTFSLPSGLTNLDTVFLEGNLLTNLNLPTGLIRLTQMDLSGNQLASFVLPADATNLISLLCFANVNLTNLILPPNLARLTAIDLDFDHLSTINFPAGLINLSSFVARQNQLKTVALPPDMRNLTFVDLSDNQLEGLVLPPSLNRLNFLRLANNHLTSLVLPEGMTNLGSIFLQGNLLSNLVLPSGLINVVQLDLRTNVLTSLTVPPDMTNLTALLLDGNPIASLVLPEPLAASNLATTVTALRNQGIPVFTYPLSVQITFPQQQPIGAFRFGITGPPGVYFVYSSTNLTTWEPLSFVNNPLGGIFFTDTDANLSPKKFYRTIRQIPPTNMVFVPPSTFKMGSLPNDPDANANERPQTTVILTHGYWIGKFEVTQREYLSVMNTNPSTFIGDLNRPVENVGWSDATNFCAKLTQLDLAGGRIPAGSHYRLPTEAEWECAARAGTSTRFSYGDDLFYAETTSYAWFLDFGNPDLITHAVGQKLPNPAGLYDVHGNVWEWCMDDYGAFPGGTQIDPTGPVSTSLQNKVIRGGAYDYPNSSCRSASRLFRFPLSPDSDVGFRVVLVSDNLE